MIVDLGILAGTPKWAIHDALVLDHTPGIPREWFLAHFGKHRREQLNAALRTCNAALFEALGTNNAASITEDDAIRMLDATPRDYAGAVPQAVHLWLSDKTVAHVAKAYGFTVNRIRRWREKQIFCPLTGIRLIQERGGGL